MLSLHVLCCVQEIDAGKVLWRGGEKADIACLLLSGCLCAIAGERVAVEGAGGGSASEVAETIKPGMFVVRTKAEQLAKLRLQFAHCRNAVEAPAAGIYSITSDAQQTSVAGSAAAARQCSLRIFGRHGRLRGCARCIVTDVKRLHVSHLFHLKPSQGDLGAAGGHGAPANDCRGGKEQSGDDLWGQGAEDGALRHHRTRGAAGECHRPRREQVPYAPTCAIVEQDIRCNHTLRVRTVATSREAHCSHSVTALAAVIDHTTLCMSDTTRCLRAVFHFPRTYINRVRTIAGAPIET